MNKFRNLTEKPKARAPVADKTQVIKTSKGIVDFVPTFNHDDVVMLIPENVEYSTDFKRIFNQPLKVDYCKVSDLEDMVVETLYLQETNENVQNPYFVEHFKKV